MNLKYLLDDILVAVVPKKSKISLKNLNRIFLLNLIRHIYYTEVFVRIFEEILK